MSKRYTWALPDEKRRILAGLAESYGFANHPSYLAALRRARTPGQAAWNICELVHGLGDVANASIPPTDPPLRAQLCVIACSLV